MSVWRMSTEQRENFENAEIQPMPVGIFGCQYVLDGDAENEDGCDNSDLWESPLFDGWEPKCMTCDRLARLIEVKDEHFH